MVEVGVLEARNQWSALLRLVERGKEIIITRDGKPIAKLVPLTPDTDRSQAQAALQRIRGRVSQVEPGAFNWDFL